MTNLLNVVTMSETQPTTTTDVVEAIASGNFFTEDLLNSFNAWIVDLGEFALDFLIKLIFAAIIFLIGWWLTKRINKLVIKALNKSNIDPAATHLMSQITLFAMRILVIITVVAQIGVNVTSLIAALGAATVTIGLALQDSLSNLASGVLIIINKPFKKDDYIEFEGLTGVVKKIEISNTILTTVDNKEVIIPNARITANNLVNYSSLLTRRLDLCYQVSYDTNLLKAKKLLSDLVESKEKFMKDPKPIIGVGKLNESNIAIDVKVWCDKDDYWDLYYEMQEEVKIMFDKNGIEIPFEQVVVHMKKEDK